MYARKAELRVSVIISLADNHGLAYECVRAWATNQTFARDQYQLVVVGASGQRLPQGMKDLLITSDLYVEGEEPELYSQFHAGALRATGELLFFSESHCLPAPDCLAEMVAYLETHEECTARCRTTVAPSVALSRLKVLEQGVFEHDIEAGLSTGWNRVLSHGFAITRETYLSTGGFDDVNYGAFTPWAFGIVLAEAGHSIGYAERSVVYHDYRGDWRALDFLIEDFVRGESAFMARHGSEICDRYLPDREEWSKARASQSGARHRLGQALVADIAWQTGHGRMRRALHGCSALFGLTRESLKPRVMEARAGMRRMFARALVELRRRDDRAAPAFRRYCDAVADGARFSALRLGIRARQPEPPCLDFEADQLPSERALGFHALEQWGGHAFRWSAPVAMLRPGLLTGSYVVSIPLLPGKRILSPADVSIYYAGRRLVPAPDSTSTTLTYALEVGPGEAGEGLVLLCSPLPGSSRAGERRALGLPLRSIRFTPLEEVGPPLDDRAVVARTAG
jgi:hypothetical protein